MQEEGKKQDYARGLVDIETFRGTFFFIACVSLCLLVRLTTPLTVTSNTSCNTLWAPQSSGTYESCYIL